MKTRWGIGALIAVALAAIPPLAARLPAQEPATRPPARQGPDPARRMPPYFAQVGLSAEQREEIYAVRRQHLARIEALRRQIEDQETQMMAGCEAVLTDAQRRLLEQRRDAAKEKAKGRAKAQESANLKKPATKTVK